MAARFMEGLTGRTDQLDLLRAAREKENLVGSKPSGFG